LDSSRKGIDSVLKPEKPRTAARVGKAPGRASEMLPAGDALLGTADARAASCSGDCLKPHEYTLLAPDFSESTSYAPDVGMIATPDDNYAGSRGELVAYSSAP
jgi:hypothetical protein